MQTQTENTIGQLTAQRRSEKGKGAARRLRSKGMIPAILYGGGANPQSLSVDPTALIRSLDPAKKKNTLIELTITGDGSDEKRQVMVKEHQENPLTQALTHVDLIGVALDQAVTVDVPFVVTGKSEGVKLGGVLHQVYRSLPVHCTPDKIPAELSVDVTLLMIGQALHVGDLTLPEGVKVMLAKEQTLVHVVVEKEQPVVETAAPVEGEAAPAAEAEAAAPAKTK